MKSRIRIHKKCHGSTILIKIVDFVLAVLRIQIKIILIRIQDKANPDPDAIKNGKMFFKNFKSHKWNINNIEKNLKKIKWL